MQAKTINFSFPPPNTRGRNIYIIAVFIAVIAFVSGCTLYSGISRKTKNITRGFKERDENMTKLIGMAPFKNQTRFSDPNQEINFSDTLIGNIESGCPGNRILHSGAADFPEFLVDLPQQNQGGIDNLELAKAGRLYGLNSVLTIVLTGINNFDAEKGFWFFKKTRYFIRAQIKAELYDTETGAKLMDEIISREVEVDLFDIELLENQDRSDIFLLEGTYEYFAKTIAEKVCDASTLQPWKGYVVSVVGDKVILSSGEASGLELGQVLEAFDSSKTIPGIEGHRFFMPGPKTGEMKITAVYDDSSEAVLGTDSFVQKGSLVKTKD